MSAIEAKLDEAGANPAVAVVGIGVWCPGANDVRQFWENVLARRQQFRRFPERRMPRADYHDPDPAAPDMTYGTRGAFIDGFEFDWAARRIPERSYESTDIVHWLALEVALKALEDAGYSRESIPTQRSAALVGNSLTGEFTRARVMRLRWPYVRRALRASAEARGLPRGLVGELEETMEDYYKSVFPPITEDTLAGVLSNTIAGRICNFLDFHGGGYVVDGACASGMIAAATAANALTHGEIDFALAGGIDISLDPMELVGFAKVGALTHGDMNVYDARGSGFIPGEGCGFVALKRLEDARADGDYVYAVIRGWGISSDGKGGITKPRADSQAEMVRRAYARAGYGIHELAFIEGHGTGTRVGDKAELEGIQLALSSEGETAPRSIGMTSMKSLVGHTKAASGMLGLIKAVIAVNRRVLPPFAGCTEPNPIFQEQAHALYPILRGEVRNGAERLRAGAQAMGFGGINCHVAVESGDERSAKLEPTIDERTLIASYQETELLVLSAPSVAAMVERARAVRELAAGMSVAEHVDLAAQLAAEVDPQAIVRAAVVAGSPDDLVEHLELLESMLAEAPPAEGELRVAPNGEVAVGRAVQATRVAFLFPGQGSQRLDMARELVERYEWARDLVAQADVWLSEVGSEPVGALVFRDAVRARDAAQLDEWTTALAQTQVTQPAVCLASMLWLRYLERLGLKPAAVAGHSLGELTAFHAAGAYDERTLIELAAAKGRAMAAPDENAGTMASLGCSRAEAEELVRQASGYVAVANINSRTQIVVAGERESVEQLAKAAEERGHRVRLLPVSNAFHCELMTRAREELLETAPVAEVLERTTVPLYSCLSTELVQPGLALREYMANQVISQVNWVELVERLSQSSDLFLEVGPGRVLSGLVNSINGPDGPACLPVASAPGRDRDLNVALAALFVRGHTIEWSELYRDRLVRPFVPASEQRFIENPIELPFQPMHVPLPSRVDAGDGAGDPGQALADYLAQRGQFLVDVVRADLGHAALPGASGDDKGAAQGAPIASEPSSADVLQPEPTPHSTDGRPDVEGRLLELVAEQTGFPAESIPRDARLLDDLNLDSIKAGEVVATAAQEFGVVDALDPAELANATVGDVAHAIRSAMPAAAAPGGGPANDVGARLLELVAEQTGFPPASIPRDARLLDDLNLDSIKAGEVVATAAREFGVVDALDPAELANATVGAIAEAICSALPTAPAAGPPAGASVAPALLDIVSHHTGFPAETLSLDLRLLDDLNLDSIKAAEIVAEAAARIGAEREIDPSELANATLGELVDVLEHAAPAARPAAAPARSGSAEQERPSWVRDFVVEHHVEPPPIVEQEDLAGAVVLVSAEADDAEVADALADAFRARGATVDLKPFAADEPASASYGYVVLLLPRPSDPNLLPETVLMRMAERLRWAATVPRAADGGRDHTTVVFVQFGGGFGPERARSGVGRTGAAAFAAGVHHERPDLRVRVVDVASQVDAAALAGRVVAELASPEAYTVAGYDAELTRRVPRPRVLQPSAYQPRDIAWSADDVVVVTGGGRGITAECALAFALATGARMALVGRSAPPSDGGGGEVAETLERLAAQGSEGSYFQCDIADPAAVEAMFARVREELGQVTGIIHGAGVNVPRRVEQVSLDAAYEEFAPKLLGAIHLLRALHDAPPKLVVGFSSIIGVTGMPGNAWYGFANEMLDAILRRYEDDHPDVATVSIAYSVWGEVGMGVRLGSAEHLAKMGVAAIPTEEGVRRFLQLVERDPGAQQVVVTARLAGLDTWRPAQPPLPEASRFLEEIVHVEPGVEVVARAQLTLERDGYLEDHEYNGSHLLPTVFGLEAMAQAAAFATGTSELGTLRIENVELERPIVAHPTDGVTIEIRAEVQERETADECRVRASIGTERTGFTREHFSATFVFGAASDSPTEVIELPEAPLDLRPVEDLYSWLLFQGPRFQRLREIWALDSNHSTFSTEALPETTGQYLLGDPYFRDTLLQAGQLVVPQELCLPVRIDRIELYPARSTAGRRTAVTRLIEKTESFIEATAVAVDGEGRVVERLQGYRARILERRDDNPTAEEIADPGERDAALIRRELAERAQALGLSVPEVSMAYVPGIHELSREERHTRELPLFEEAVARLLANGGGRRDG